MRDVFEMRKMVGPDPHINGTGGIASMEDAVQMMMCGADSIGLCTETMLTGSGSKMDEALKEIWSAGVQDGAGHEGSLIPRSNPPPN
jgi:dihydroorotate dehydrogenase